MSPSGPSRRDVLQAAVGSAFGLVLASSALGQSTQGASSARAWFRAGAHAGPSRAPGFHQRRPAFVFDWKELGKEGGPIVCRAGFGEGGNSLAVIQRGVGAVLIDTKNAPYGSLLAQDVIALDEVPVDKLQSGAHPAEVKLVINTHHHYDHTGGNHAFAGKVDHLAHPKAIERIKGQLKRYQDGATAAIRTLTSSDKPADQARARLFTQEFGASIANWTAANFAPTRELKGDTETVELGKIKMVLHHFGSGHTDNDIVVHLPDQNVIHMGDVLFNKFWPYFDVASGATSKGWIQSCSKAIEMCDRNTVLVPGHGELADSEALKRQIALFEELVPKAQAAVKAGKTKEEFQKIQTPGYDGYAAADFIRPITLGGLYDEAKAAAK